LWSNHLDEYPIPDGGEKKSREHPELFHLSGMGYITLTCKRVLKRYSIGPKIGSIFGKHKGRFNGASEHIPTARV